MCSGAEKERLPEVKTVRVRAVRKTDRVEDVYDLTVPEYHCFAVNGGIIVHNSIDAVRYATEQIWRRKGQ